MENLSQDKMDICFLLGMLSEWSKPIPAGLDPTLYHTLSYSGDVEIKERFDKIAARIGKFLEEP